MESYWKFILIGAGVLILGIIGLVLGLSKTILKNKTARDVAKWLGIISSVIGAILIIVGLIIYFRKSSKMKMAQQYGMMPPQQQGYGMMPPPGYGMMPPQQQGYGTMPPPGYGMMPPQQQGYGMMPPQQQGYGMMPPEQQGYE